MNPKISVVIPAYNEEKYISKPLESLKKQNYPRDSYEIIVVDHASSDATGQIAKELGAIVVRKEDKKGVGDARQHGFEAAKGEIIASTDADTELPENWLSVIDEKLKNPDIICVGGKAVPSEGNFIIFFLFRIYHQFLLVNQFFGKTLPWGFNFAVRKEAFEKIGGFNIELRTSEDWDLALRLQSQFGKKAVVYDSDLVAYTSTRKQNNTLVFLRYLWSGLKNYLFVVILGKVSKSEDMMMVR